MNNFENNLMPKLIEEYRNNNSTKIPLTWKKGLSSQHFSSPFHNNVESFNDIKGINNNTDSFNNNTGSFNNDKNLKENIGSLNNNKGAFNFNSK